MPLDRPLGSPITLSLPIRVEAPGPYPGPDQRLLVFCGKGGVGKTTLACATALHITATEPHRRTLLFSSDPAHSVWATAWTFPSDPSRLRLPRALPRWEVDANIELAVMRSAYGEELRVFFTKRSSNLDFTFNRRVMEQMMDFAPPGIDELAALARAVVVLREGAYDLLVLDAASSGHLIRLLELPELLDDWLQAMFELLLKYKDTLGVPRFGQRLMQLSKDLKFLRGLFGNRD